MAMHCLITRKPLGPQFHLTGDMVGYFIYTCPLWGEGQMLPVGSIHLQLHKNNRPS